MDYREARQPFLDEAFMTAVLDLPLPLVADMGLPAGTGDKQLLRECLRLLGCTRAAARVKRAIQFGSRIGKLMNVHHFGSNHAANVQHAGSVRLAFMHTEAEQTAPFGVDIQPDSGALAC